MGTLRNSDYSGVYEVVRAFREYNSCIGLAEVMMIVDDSGEYALGTENSNVTFADIKGAEIIG